MYIPQIVWNIAHQSISPNPLPIRNTEIQVTQPILTDVSTQLPILQTGSGKIGPDSFTTSASLIADSVPVNDSQVDSSEPLNHARPVDSAVNPACTPVQSVSVVT